MKTFVIGDIHGAYKALLQCIDRSGINKDTDTLICLGDVCDGYAEVYECFEELSSFKNLIFIMGNHDQVFLEWLHTGIHPWRWLQGGDLTAKSYAKKVDYREVDVIPVIGGWETNLTFTDVPLSHQKLLKNAHYYYVDDSNRLFVHGGYNRDHPIDETLNHSYYWDRSLFFKAMSVREPGVELKTYDNFSKIFLGHTPTINWNTTDPIKAAQVWNIDTGAGWKGKLTIMDVDTEEYWQSDKTSDLY